MQTRYGRITNNEREEISRSLAKGKPISEIATELGRHRTMIFREIKRNCGKSGCHRPELVADMLRIGWPPWFGITGRLAPDYALLKLYAAFRLN